MPERLVRRVQEFEIERGTHRGGSALRRVSARIWRGRAEKRGTFGTARAYKPNTGHSGFGTLHSNDARETITRLTNAPMSVPNIMISAIDFIIMQNRIYRPDGVSFRRISEVAEVSGIEEGVIQLNKIFEWDPQSDTIKNVGITSKTLTEIAKVSGNSLNSLYDEIKNREIVLQHMVDQNIRSIRDVSTVLEMYYLDSQKVLNRILLAG